MEILQRPIVTEKMNSKGESLRQYGFIVNKIADKFQIKEAVEKMYGVTVESVNTMRYASISKTRFTKTGVLTGRTSSYKKAIVTLKSGDLIDFYSNI
ncbi:MAG: 50S ribosomal protein L23 [Bacteroidales bacterium]|nr:50S ribosomal protein L23 [Bacteroidales bacterium]